LPTSYPEDHDATIPESGINLFVAYTGNSSVTLVFYVWMTLRNELALQHSYTINNENKTVGTRNSDNDWDISHFSF